MPSEPNDTNIQKAMAYLHTISEHQGERDESKSCKKEKTGDIPREMDRKMTLDFFTATLDARRQFWGGGVKLID